MTRDDAINELKFAIDLIKQDGKDWLDERDIPILHMAIEALEHLDNIEAYMHDFDVTEEEATKALERQQGKWIERSITHDRRDAKIPEWQSAKCSVCGKYHTTPFLYNIKWYNYCPNCGADMRGGEHE